jgi:hypothetical protein
MIATKKHKRHKDQRIICPSCASLCGFTQKLLRVKKPCCLKGHEYDLEERDSLSAVLKLIKAKIAVHSPACNLLIEAYHIFSYLPAVSNSAYQRQVLLGNPVYKPIV